ncbi:MAG: glutamyl-tRNA reductase [Proteobacteria bacterium]|nr:glutamyl-tRNA reductase [Pseudomonadota bacterium]
MTTQENKYYSVGLNHDTCPLDLRAALAIGDHEIDSALKNLLMSDSISESVILSTCNRTEIYSYASDPDEIVSWYAQFRGFSKQELSSVLYQNSGELVAQHAFRVASGLDSMVLGETQIFGQLKNAVRMADSVGALGPRLRQLFDASFSVAKFVRTETDVGAHSVSLAAASVKVGERIFGSLFNANVLFVGAGEMNRICAEYFVSYGVQNVSCSNRTVSRAKDLAEKFSGDYFPLSDVAHKLSEFDIVVSCTGSPIPVLGKRSIEKATEIRRHKPILLIDLAVPRDIELEASELEDVFLYTVDDLGKIVNDGMRNREDAAREAEKIIAERLVQFKSQIDRKKIIPVIKKFRKRGELIVQIELEKALSSIAKGERPENVVKALSRAISNKFMDEPSRALNNDSTGEKLSLSEALERLYGLNKN